VTEKIRHTIANFSWFSSIKVGNLKRKKKRRRDFKEQGLIGMLAQVCTSMYCSIWLPVFGLWKALGISKLYKAKMVQESRKSHEANKLLQGGKIGTCKALN